MLRDRVLEMRRVRADTLRPHPLNWRSHPPGQVRALHAALDEIGFVGALVARPLADGSLELVDGHLRAETLPDAELPVLVVDLSDDEAARLLAVYDPLAGLAEAHAARLSELVASIELRHAALQEVVADVLDRRARDMDDILRRNSASRASGSSPTGAATNSSASARHGADEESDGESDNNVAASEAPNNSSKIPKQFRATYQVVVECTSEQQQRVVYERLTEEGLRCRVLTLT
jgi:hypothetical protein